MFKSGEWNVYPDSKWKVDGDKIVNKSEEIVLNWKILIFVL